MKTVDLFNLDKKYADEMLAHAVSEAPNECCGILAGINNNVVKLYRTTNTERSPSKYKINSQEMFSIYKEISENRWELLGVYHSHVQTEAYPSSTDVKSALLPESIYFIISLRDPERVVIRGFLIKKGKVTEIELRITG
jgi:[CysO sulfur-carrier protein]-S-L-cysteine hydrolase